MSSAILYLAIIAIWACVLIPRWLKRDSARTAAAEDATDASHAAPAEPDAADATEPYAEDGPAVPDGAARDAAASDAAGEGTRARDTAVPARAPASREEARRRVLAARRRLLWMMLGLEAAGAALAATRLAAWWVIAPPTVMLTGYLLLLREAAQADAHAGRREREAIEAAQSRARERARRAGERLARPATAVPPAVPVAFAAAPVPGDYEDLGAGRDFTPGLRHQDPDDSYASDDAYDQYTENRLRAVGD